MARGVVTAFNDAKGYGFLAGADGRQVFVHYSAIAATLVACSAARAWVLIAA